MNENLEPAANTSTLVVPLLVVIVGLLMMVGISYEMAATEKPVDPIIKYLQEQQPTQPFGGAEEPFVNHPPLHKASTRLMLRKLHLVRPDLIPYPLDIRVYA